MILIAILLAVSIVLNIVERFAIQGFTGLPMIRLGLANIVVLIILYTYGSKDAFMILLLRIFTVALLTTGLFSPGFFLSLSGGLVAFTLMFIIKKMPGFTIVSVSVLGSVGHAIGQIMMAVFILSTQEIAFLLPLMLVISVPTGVFVGLVAKRIITILSASFFYEQY